MRFAIAFAVFAVLSLFLLAPHWDVAASALFFRDGFYLRDQAALVVIHDIAFYGARALGALFVMGIIYCLISKKPLLGLSLRAFVFLLVTLIVGPGLIANSLFKDQFGRARPVQIVEFGGSAQFSPPLIPSNQCAKNCSFVSGDGAFGFWLTAFALLAAPQRRKAMWVATLIAGGIFGATRIMMGAHFLSDVLFAAAFMITINLLCYRFIMKEKP